MTKAAFGAGASHPDVIEVFHKGLCFFLFFEQESSLEVAFCLGLGPDARTSQIWAADKSHPAINNEDFGMHADAVEEFDPSTELAFGVYLFVSLPERLGR